MKFEQKIRRWYLQNKRDLPWRKTKDPYLIWLSEIILQQTRIDQGMSYYHRFSQRFPDVFSLANATEDQVLKHWQGLGYYTRARNLHKAAKQIVIQHGGWIPETYDAILELPGIGDYTAAAIASIAFGKPYPVVDGNVMRVISRIYGIDTPVNTNKGKKEILQKLQKLISPKDPGTFNQAVMEFGALHCKPANPDCNTCIFKKDCEALKKNMVGLLPRKEPKIKTKKRFFNYLVLIDKGSSSTEIWLSKRTHQDIWKNLYEFPGREDSTLWSIRKLKNKLQMGGIKNTEINISQPFNDYRHILTHQQIHARFFRIEAKEEALSNILSALSISNSIKINAQDVSSYAIPRLIDRFRIENNVF
ncbi:MAG: A/G-specific adenine glycosylase [Bacteroidetes bacterium]|nr:A/G-specific adenine glycosylase [Bacteroidota bacterium]